MNTKTAPPVAATAGTLRAAIRELRHSGRSIGLVPTMGALHDGHLGLVEASVRQCDATVVSIFVNPTQFAPHEDLARYPRMLEQDLQRLAGSGTDLVFAPPPEAMYPPGCETRVQPGSIARRLEGESRPTHFQGVATIVLKLFQLSGADAAFFGQKDYQQSLVVRHMVRDLNLPIDIVVCPIVRDDDGLALSSRNVFLDASQRTSALALYRTLQAAANLIGEGETDGRVITAEMVQSLITGGVSQVDYAVLADPETLETLETVRLPAVLLVAARVGNTRLIDNLMVRQGNNPTF